jgi:cardiolipin synthase A/B
MKYRLYTTSYRAWDGMFKAMKKAKKFVYLEMYILDSDTEHTHNFFSLLKEKASQGIEVVIIADAYGSLSLESQAVKELRQAGAEFIFFSHWLKRTHRKILIVDNETAFLGGVNIKEKSRNWRDLQIRIEGAPVKLIIKSFANSYYRCGGKRESILRFSYTPLSKKIKNFIIDNWPSTNKLYNLNSYYKRKILQAKFLLQIVTPYLLPPRWLLAALDDACRRGVKVEIIIPKYTDIKYLDRINFINACRLSRIGVKFYLGREMNHAKLMLIDKKEAAIGSQNMDIFSFEFNYEVGVFSRQKDLVADVEKIIEIWKKEAKSFKGWEKDIKFFNRFLLYFYRIFYPIF